MEHKRVLIVLLVCCMAGVSCSGPGSSTFVGNNEVGQRINGVGATPTTGALHSLGVAGQVLALTPPSGVNTKLFAELQNELARQVSAISSQQVLLHPPVGSANRIGDLMFDGQELSWSYANAGDYDLNGEVNGADITPIVLYYGKASGDADWLAAEVADGDGNGEVNLGDITPIAIHFGSSLSGYVVLGSESEGDYPDEPTGADGAGVKVLGEVSVDELFADEFSRQTYKVTPSTELTSHLYWVRPVLYDQCGVASYQSTNVGIGLDFEPRRLNRNNLHDPTLDGTFIVKASRTAEEITLDVWATDTEAEEYVAIEIDFDTTRFRAQSYQSTFDRSDLDQSSFISLGFADGAEAGDMIQHKAGSIVHFGPFSQFTFSLEPYSTEPIEYRVGTSLVDETYQPHTLDEADWLKGFTVNNPNALPMQPASFTIYSLFMAGDGDDNGKVNIFDVFELGSQGNFGNATWGNNFAPAGTDYDHNGEAGLADIGQRNIHLFEAVDTIEVLIWDTGEYAEEVPAMAFSFFDGTPSKRHDTYPFAATTDWRDVFRSWDGEITIGMMQAADLNEDGEVLVSARLRYEDQLGLPFTGIPFIYSE